MKLLSKIFFSILTASAISQFSLAADSDFTRIIQTIEIIPYAGPHSIKVLDTGHQYVISKGLYSQNQADALDARSFAAFYNSYGIDFSDDNDKVIHNDDGTRTLDIDGKGNLLLWIPYLLGKDENIILTQDKLYPKRTLGDEEGNWFNLQAGAIVVPVAGHFTTYVVTSGNDAGAVIKESSIWGDIDLNLLRKGREEEWKKGNCKYREILHSTANHIGERVKSQWGDDKYIQSLLVKDKDNQWGFGHSGTTIIKSPNKAGPQQKFLHTVDTWWWPKGHNN